MEVTRNLCVQNDGRKNVKDRGKVVGSSRLRERRICENGNSNKNKEVQLTSCLVSVSEYTAGWSGQNEWQENAFLCSGCIHIHEHERNRGMCT
jgi:hypothetical protein